MAMARVQARGQVTIPQEVRESCGIAPGTDLLFVNMEPGRFECLVLPPRRSVLDVVDEYAADGVAPDLDELRKQIAEDIARDQLGDHTEPEPVEAR